MLVVQQRAQVGVAAVEAGALQGDQREQHAGRGFRRIAACCDGWRPRAGTASRARHSGTISRAASAASTTKIARHENSSVRTPPSAAPASNPHAEAATRFAIASWRRSYGTSSPMATSASGKNAAATPPVTRRMRRQHRQAAGQRRGGDDAGERDDRDGDHAHRPDPVGERPPRQLADAVRDQVRRDRDPGGATDTSKSAAMSAAPSPSCGRRA